MKRGWRRRTAILVGIVCGGGGFFLPAPIFFLLPLWTNNGVDCPKLGLIIFAVSFVPCPCVEIGPRRIREEKETTTLKPLPHFDCVLFTFLSVLPGFTGFYWVLLAAGENGCYMMLRPFLVALSLSIAIFFHHRTKGTRHGVSFSSILSSGNR